MKATFKLNKSCKSVDKYDEINAEGKIVKDSGQTPLLGTVYVSKAVAKGRDVITITVED